MKFPGTFILLGVFVYTAQSVDVESIRERRCIYPKTDPNLDVKWLESVEEWYFPLISKLEVFRVASDVLQMKVLDIPESAVLNEPCFTCDPVFNCVGFGSTTPMAYDCSYDKDYLLDYKAKRPHAIGGKITLAYTDNKNFVIGVVCWEDDEASFGVWTPSPEPLPAAVKTQVLYRLQELGFDPKFFVERPCSGENKIKSEL